MRPRACGASHGAKNKRPPASAGGLLVAIHQLCEGVSSLTTFNILSRIVSKSKNTLDEPVQSLRLGHLSVALGLADDTHCQTPGVTLPKSRNKMLSAMASQLPFAAYTGEHITTGILCRRAEERTDQNETSRPGICTHVCCCFSARLNRICADPGRVSSASANNALRAAYTRSALARLRFRHSAARRSGSLSHRGWQLHHRSDPRARVRNDCDRSDQWHSR